jgi:uncharacterized protein with HEPN domain
MARRFTPERLRHILQALADVEALTRGRTVDDYLGDRFLRLAVERCLEIVSEASRFIPEELKARHPTLPWRGIADFGNLLRHGYEAVDHRRVWAIVEHDLAPLAAAIEAMRRDLDPPAPPDPAHSLRQARSWT